MAEESASKRMRSWSTIVGFACNQGFLYALFYLEPQQTLSVFGMPFARAELLGTLLFMCLSLYAVSALQEKLRRIVLSSRFVLAYAIILVLGAGVPAFVGTQDLISIAYESICVGIPSALMLCAWGRVLGAIPVRSCAPDVFIGLGLGAAICFVFSVVPVDGMYALLYFAPLGSALLLRKVESVESLAEGKSLAVGVGSASENVVALSFKILLGTALFGLSVGLIEGTAYRFEAEVNDAPITFFLFVLFCIAALQLFGGRSAQNGFEGGPGQVASRLKLDDSPLDGSYRLAVLLLVSGLLLIPVLNKYFGISGESIVLVGYLAINAVLITLFLLMAHVLSHDSSLAFARGFMALFVGEFAGLLIANAINMVSLAFDPSDLLTAAAGIIVLVAYLFLFTNRDMKELSVAVEKVDTFELSAAKIIEQASLSKRESEILPFVLRGRSSERIASELYISKNTVDTHIRKIYAKCQVHSRQELIDYAERIRAEIGL